MVENELFLFPKCWILMKVDVSLSEGLSNVILILIVSNLLFALAHLNSNLIFLLWFFHMGILLVYEWIVIVVGQLLTCKDILHSLRFL
jgi:membrane protease YdiL (CAAX protease family)